MTSLSKRKSRPKFVTDDVVREAGKLREISAECFPRFVRVWAKGMHSTYDVPWSAIWSSGVKASMEQKLRLIKEAKKARKRA
jgi:hypothetical protein